MGLGLLGLRMPWGEDLLAPVAFSGHARVIDGDSLEIEGKRVRIPVHLGRGPEEAADPATCAFTHAFACYLLYEGTPFHLSETS